MIAHRMAGAEDLLRYRHPCGIDQIQRTLQQVGNQVWRTGRIVSAIAVHQHVHIGFDVREHAPHHIALALQRLAAHDRARRSRD
jgi:hypothetical protein